MPTARLKATRDDDRRGIEDEAPAGDAADGRRDGETDDDADQAAEQRQCQGLDQELAEDVAAARAEAFRMPISRVRSRTETSMMFMIPMPPTTSAIEAMPAEQQGQRAADRRGGCEQLRLVEDLEVVGTAGGDAVAGPQQLGRSALRDGHLVGAWRR